MAEKSDFRALLISLWVRFITISVVALLIPAVPQLDERVTGWPFFLNPGEIVFEVGIYVLFIALCAAVLATFLTAIIAPFLLRERSRERIAAVAVQTAVAIAAFIVLRVLLGVLLARVGLQGHKAGAIFALYYLAFVAALIRPKQRKQLVGCLDGILGEQTTRRTAIGLGVATAAVAASESVLGKLASSSGPAPSPQTQPSRYNRPAAGRNILLITFDALSAEDMSLYGYHLPTTPHIDDFARTASVFSGFFSASTFTTPAVASILTGLYPSEHHVYHLQGRLRGEYAAKALPHIMREHGYATGASISSPYAYLLNEDLRRDYNVLPDMAYRTKGFRRLWDGTEMLHQNQPLGSRTRELMDLEFLWDYIPGKLEQNMPGHFARLDSHFPPEQSFAQARKVADSLPDGFFLWVHVMTPHAPYLPGPSDAGRFLQSNEMRTETAQTAFHYWPRYEAAQQGLIDKARLRYDETLAEADRAFGSFMAGLDAAGRLQNTAVIVSADHGESFQGGIYTHASQYQVRQQIHVPLIVRMPGQAAGQLVPLTADQTALAPTILEIAGVARPGWMRGRSLVPLLNRDAGAAAEGGIAFTQYLATNSIFKPLHNGTVGVIDGAHQYVLDLNTGKGILRSLAEATSWNADHSAEDPALAEKLRAAIYSRFPDLRGSSI